MNDIDIAKGFKVALILMGWTMSEVTSHTEYPVPGLNGILGGQRVKLLYTLVDHK